MVNKIKMVYMKTIKMNAVHKFCDTRCVTPSLGDDVAANEEHPQVPLAYVHK